MYFSPKTNYNFQYLNTIKGLLHYCQSSLLQREYLFNDGCVVGLVISTESYQEVCCFICNMTQKNRSIAQHISLRLLQVQG